MSDTTISRKVARVVAGVRTLEGAGFSVRRPFPTASLDHFDPFLLLDEMGPMELGPGEARGAPDHPHRGFETVTYLRAGTFEHRDSQGNHGKLAPGDVQWMTAGAGVIHSEMPSEAIMRAGGRMHGFQLWVNLPRRDKMMAPRYQDVPAARIPEATSPDGLAHVRIIAGEAFGKSAVIDTRTPIEYLHFTLAPGARVEQRLPRDHNAFVYVFSGRVSVGADGQAAQEGDMVLLGMEGDGVTLACAREEKESAELLLLAGQPLGEPVARYGPFVMNSRDEIAQAIEDFRSGRFGSIPARIG